MRIEFTAENGFVRIARTFGQKLQDAANEAVKNTTEEVKGRAKAEVATGLAGKVANTVTAKPYPNSDGSVGGYVYSRWYRRPAGGKVLGSANNADIRAGRKVLNTNDILAGFTSVNDIHAVKAKMLLIPFIGRKLLKRNPVNFNDPGVELIRTNSYRKKYLFGGPGYLVVQKGIKGGARKRNKGLPLGLLRQSVRIPKKLDFTSVVEFRDERLPEQFILSLDRRSLLD